MKQESQTLREIISDHVFYALIIVGITISVYRVLPEAAWKESWNLIIFLSVCSLVLDYLNFMSRLQIRRLEDYISDYITDVISENIEDPFEEVDKETTKEQK
jgi:hypothetical protein